MVTTTETERRSALEEVPNTTLSWLTSEGPGTGRWWSLVSDKGLIYPDGALEEHLPSPSAAEPASPELSDRPGWYEFLDILRNALAVDSPLVESLRRWARQTQEQAVEHFLAREAAKLECVLAIKADARQDALDILFVVEGDLFDSERTVLPLMRRVRDNFSNIPFDVMVLPASQYSERFRWGQAPKTIFQRIGRDEHGARAR